jgi:hypothetical protein
MSSLTGAVTTDKARNGAIIRLFHFRREQTAGQLVVLAVISNTLTALSFPGTWFIGAGALIFIFLHMAFHYPTPPISN